MSDDPTLLAILALLLLAAAIGLFVSTLGSEERVESPDGAPVKNRASNPLRLSLARAGMRGDAIGGWYFGSKVGLALLAAISVLAFTGPFVLPGEGRTFLALFAAALGFVAPSGYVRVLGAQRQDALQRSLPDLIDLIVTCLEAGMGLEEAVRRASGQVARYGSPLAAELETTLEDWADGRSRIGAIEELRVRTGVDALAEFMEAVEEARRDGTTITETLRGQAIAMRKAEAARAEARAQRVPLLVAVTLAVFMLPAAFIGVLGSSVVQAVRALSSFGG
ncbi:MAG: type II secretion system F family protein [Deltaproteobacteria bacterium]|nr:type II secretion system F family protein [Deltaproteobacteria bacterium]